MMTVRISSFDFDGCLFNPAYCKESLSAENRDVIQHNTRLFEMIRAENHALMAESPDFKMTCFIGSNRQSKRIDTENAVYVDYGLFIEKGSCFNAIQRVSDYLHASLDPTLLADIFGNLPAGESYRRAMTTDYRGDHAETYFDETKLTLVYAQIHKAAMDNPGADIIYDFYDDREDILRILHRFFKKFPELLPSNVNMRLHRYDGALPQMFGLVQGKGVAAGGVPFIDRNYRDTVQHMVQLASTNDQDYRKKLDVIYSLEMILEDIVVEEHLNPGLLEEKKALFKLFTTLSTVDLSSAEEMPNPAKQDQMAQGKADAAPARKDAFVQVPVAPPLAAGFFTNAMMPRSEARRRKVTANTEQLLLSIPGARSTT